MALLCVIFVLLVIGCISAGVIAHRRHWSVAGGPTAWGNAAAERFGSIGGAAIVLVSGWVAVIAVGLALGFLAKHIQHAVDEPVFRWVNPRVSGNSFTSLNEKLTYMGNTPIIEVVSLVGIVLLACIYRRRWWLPVIGIVVSFLDERLLQNFLAKVVDRGHPPTTLGTYPSGGVGRLLGVYAAIVILAIMVIPRLSRAWRAGLWTGLATAGVIEAFTRVYLSKHWFTDALFALPFGTLLLLTNVAAITALAYRDELPDRAEADHSEAAERSLRDAPAPSQP
jgi:hypothetical protein